MIRIRSTHQSVNTFKFLLSFLFWVFLFNFFLINYLIPQTRLPLYQANKWAHMLPQKGNCTCPTVDEFQLQSSSFNHNICKFKSLPFYTQQHMPLVFPIPPLSTSFAHLLTFFFASSYVGSLYISKFTRLSFSSQVNPTQNGGVRRKEIDERWRDDPDVIRARLAAVIGATILCCAGLLGVLWHLVGDGINVRAQCHTLK